jgi:hypothetical protein
VRALFFCLPKDSTSQGVFSRSCSFGREGPAQSFALGFVFPVLRHRAATSVDFRELGFSPPVSVASSPKASFLCPAVVCFDFHSVFPVFPSRNRGAAHRVPLCRSFALRFAAHAARRHSLGFRAAAIPGSAPMDFPTARRHQPCSVFISAKC